MGMHVTAFDTIACSSKFDCYFGTFIKVLVFELFSGGVFHIQERMSMAFGRDISQ